MVTSVRGYYGGAGNGRSLLCHKDGPLEGKTFVVVGAGPVGIWVALELAAQGATVILVAAHKLGFGIGFLNAAGLHEPVATEDPDATKHFLYGLDLWSWLQPDATWGIQHRSVLFMSDDQRKLEQEWIEALPTVRPAAAQELPAGGPAHGVWFETVVLQPDLTLVALRRELKRAGVKIDPRTYTFRTCSGAVEYGKSFNADAVIIAAGLGLADFDDLWDIDGLGEWLGLAGGVGATKKIARKDLPSLDYVLMNVDATGYLIPQRDWIIAGGTNIRYEAWDPMVQETRPAAEMIAEVEEKIDALWPGAASLPGKWLLGARPMRDTILKHYLEPAFFGIPVILLGGVGGSGWTFCASLARDVSDLLVEQLGEGERRPIFPEVEEQVEETPEPEAPVSVEEPPAEEPRAPQEA